MRSPITRLKADERGAISIVSLFALLLLTMLLGMVINVARQADSKVKMQNAADAVTYSSGVVLARGMNTLAFTNHMLCDVFALTAFLREGRERNAEKLVPEVLLEWKKIAPLFAKAPLAKIAQLAQGIPPKADLEQKLVTAYGDWMQAVAEVLLPTLDDQILKQQLIPEFQRTLIEAVPKIAQATAREIARRHDLLNGSTDPRRGAMLGVLWRPTLVDPVGGSQESTRHTLPAIFPESVAEKDEAVAYRQQLARQYLGVPIAGENSWNFEMLSGDDNLPGIARIAKMSQFGGSRARHSIAGGIWEAFTCGQLENLLQEYPNTNLPCLLRPLPSSSSTADVNRYLDEGYVFLGVVYWPQVSETMHGVFQNPMEPDAQAFAQGMLFVPRRRLMKHTQPAQPDDENHGWHWHVDQNGRLVQDPPDHIYRSSERPMDWTLWNQNWTFQLMPATSDKLLSVLEANPHPITASGTEQVLKLPRFKDVNPSDIYLINTH